MAMLCPYPTTNVDPITWECSVLKAEINAPDFTPTMNLDRPKSSIWAAELVPPLFPNPATTCLKAAAFATDSLSFPCLCP